VLSVTVASIRPVNTCAVDGVAYAARRAAHNTIDFAIRTFISILQDEELPNCTNER
jgi:hypothetical protein